MKLVTVGLYALLSIAWSTAVQAQFAPQIGAPPPGGFGFAPNPGPPGSLGPPERPSAVELATNCSSCHSPDGVLQTYLRSIGQSQAALPTLDALPANQIVAQLKAFRSGDSQAAVMHRVAKQYSDSEIREVADYVSRRPAVR